MQRRRPTQFENDIDTIGAGASAGLQLRDQLSASGAALDSLAGNANASMPSQSQIMGDMGQPPAPTAAEDPDIGQEAGEGESESYIDELNEARPGTPQNQGAMALGNPAARPQGAMALNSPMQRQDNTGRDVMSGIGAAGNIANATVDAVAAGNARRRQAERDAKRQREARLQAVLGRLARQ